MLPLIVMERAVRRVHDPLGVVNGEQVDQKLTKEMDSDEIDPESLNPGLRSRRCSATIQNKLVVKN